MDKQEENYAFGLREAVNLASRARARRIPRLILERMDQAVQKKESGLWIFIFMIAIFNDLADLMIIGSIPLFGDALDFATSAVLVPFMFSLGGQLRIRLGILAIILSVIEFIPFPLIEMLNLWTAAVLWGYFRVSQRAELAQKALEKYRKRGKIDREAMKAFS